MSNSDFDDARFGGIARLYGQTAAKQLAKAHACVIGIGGVGSWVAEALVRSGIGEITLIDLDDVCVTNTNRQIHATAQHIGQPKVAVMKARLLDIYPKVTVHAIEEFIDHDNIAELIIGFSVVVDAIDSAHNKAHLIAHCKRHKIPIITTGAAGGQKDPSQVSVRDLSRTHNDPLAAKVRNTLRRHYGFSRNEKRSFGVPCIYSTEQLSYPQPDGEVCTNKSAMQDGVRLDCTGGFGAATMVTASFGMLAASKAIERIIKSADTSSVQSMRRA